MRYIGYIKNFASPGSKAWLLLIFSVRGMSYGLMAHEKSRDGPVGSSRTRITT